MDFTKKRFKLLLAGGSCLVCLLIMELFISYFELAPDYKFYPGPFVPHPDYDYQLKPDHRGVQGNVPIELNADGFRGSPFSAGTESETRILLVGDSFTFGWGVAYASTFPGLLETCLKDGGNDVRVINSGVPGYSIWHEHQFLETNIEEIHPDVVVLVLVQNDYRERTWMANPAGTLTRIGTENMRGGYIEVVFNNPTLSRVSGIYRVVKNVLRNRFLSRRRSQGAIDLEARETWEGALGYIEGMRSASAERGAEFLVLDMSNSQTVYDELTQRGFVLKRHSYEKKDALPNDRHPSPRAHRDIHRALTELLRTRITTLSFSECDLPRAAGS